MKNDLKRMVEIIESNESFLLLSHIDPDGDAIGSLIALSLLLERKAKRTVAYDRDGVPEIYRFLEGSDRIVSSIPSNEKFDVALFVECPTVQRVGYNHMQELKNIPLWVNVDHHVDNARFGHLNIVDKGLSATGEFVYALFEAMNEPVDSIVANALYTCIMTDTGSYKYSNTTPQAHEISARLIALGVKPYDVFQEVYENLSPSAALIAARAHATLQIDGNISSITITRKMLEETGAGPEDTSEIVNFGRSIGCVEVALLFRETEDNIKVSLRSKNLVDVNAIAVRFGGGGHLRAAGCNIKGEMDEVKGMVYKAVKEALEESGKSGTKADGC